MFLYKQLCRDGVVSVMVVLRKRMAVIVLRLEIRKEFETSETFF